MNSGIYKILNKVNNKIYIGSAKDFINRKSKHFGTLSNNKHHSIYLQRAYNKYGFENFIFEVIEEVELNKEKLLEREQYYIDKLKSEYNICKIAGSCLGVKHSKETKRKMSEAKKRLCQSEEFLIKMSECSKKANTIKGPKEYWSTHSRFGSKNPNSIINESIARLIKIDLINNIRIKDIMIKHNVTRGIVRGIKENDTWKNITI